MKFRNFLIPLLFLPISTPSFGLKYFLSEDLGVQGKVRRCQYSDGQIYTVNSINLCPMSVDAPSPNMGTGTGFYKGTYLDGMTRVCVYDVLGNQRGIRVNSTNICPLTKQF